MPAEPPADGVDALHQVVKMGRRYQTLKFELISYSKLLG
jgi:hypothetical protein